MPVRALVDFGVCMCAGTEGGPVKHVDGMFLEVCGIEL